MEFLIEFILALVIEGSLEGANSRGLPKSVRIVLLMIVTLVYIAFTIFFVGLFLTLDNIFGKILSAGVVLFFIGVLIYLWCKVMKAKE